jgi:hypothetical protein
MSTRVVSTSLFIPLIVLLGVFFPVGDPAAVYGQTYGEVKTFGGRAGWDIFSEFTNTRFSPGWEGGEDVVLTDAARTIRTETDLLAGFDGAIRDSAGRYALRNQGVQVVSSPRRFGSGAAAFDGSSSVAFLPGEDSLFAPDTQPGSFVIDFWLHPHHVTEGATIFHWRGALLDGHRPVLQDLRLEIHDRRLQWVLSNLVIRAHEDGVEPTETIRLTARRGLVPRIWQHHQLRYDSTTGQIAYLLDGMPEAVRYLSDSGREDGSRHAILFGRDTGEGVIIGTDFQGVLDEFRISRSVSDGPQASRYTGEPGSVVSEPVDLGGSGARLDAIKTRAHEPGVTEVRGYYRIADIVISRDPREALDSDWKRIPSSGTIPGNERGRFLQLRFDLLADAAREESPRLQAVTIHHQVAVAPPPPRVISGTAISGGVEISWDQVLQGDVAGYRVYFGERPRRYTGVAGSISPLDVGPETAVAITGLVPDVPYVFAVESYDRYGQASSLSREIEVRAGGGGGGTR